MSKKVAVVTGGNKGIGFAIVRGLCKQIKRDIDIDIYLTARNEELGQKAVEELSKKGLTRNPKFHQLDITDGSSIDRIRDFLKATYGGLDILVNSAGISYTAASTVPFSEQAEVSIATNYTGTLNLCNALFPLLRDHARVVNVSGMFSSISIKKCSSDVRAKFTDPNITFEQCTAYLNDFINATKTDKHIEKGYSNSAYGMSKVGVTVMSFIQAREMAKDKRKDIVINACCPGYVATDMSSHKGNKTIDQGAETPLYLALLPEGVTDPVGKMVSEKKVVVWAG